MKKWAIYSQSSISYFRHNSASKNNDCAFLFLGEGLAPILSAWPQQCISITGAGENLKKSGLIVLENQKPQAVTTSVLCMI